MPGRYYTSYGDYRDYNSDDLFDDMYPAAINGVFTPQPFDGHITPYKEIAPSPVNGNGRLMSGRPKSRMRAPSRTEIGVQTDSRGKPRLSETQYNYTVPDQTVRPTSPVQRLLDRWKTQPTISLNQPPPGSQMDPVTKQYYQRLWSSKSPSSEIHLNRYGRAGGVWRHVRACVANTGTQLAFIDGTVKEEDNVFFPPWKIYRKSQMKTNIQPQLFTSYPSQQNQTTAKFTRVPSTRRVLSAKPSTYRNKFNTHAKEGFKYWYQEPKPIESKREELARRRIMMSHYKQPASIC